MKRTCLAVLTFILLIMAASGCSLLDGSTLVEEQAVAEATPTPTPVPWPMKIGDVCESRTMDIKLTEAMTVEGLGFAPFNTVHAEGNIFLALLIDVTNKTSGSLYFNYMNFRAEADGEEVELTLPAIKEFYGRTAAIGNIGAEETGTYFLIYEIPAGWRTFRVRYYNEPMYNGIAADFSFTALNVNGTEQGTV